MKPYIIAETAYNHEGSIIELAKMVDDAKLLGLDAIKFHLMLDVDSYITKDHELNKKYKEWKINKQIWISIFNLSIRSDLDIVALCDDIKSIRFVKENYGYQSRIGLVSIELHATSLNDIYMLHEINGYKGRVILGVGGSTIDEIAFAVNYLNKIGIKDIVLMYGFQTYPTDYNLINLSKMQKLKNIFGLPIGYADHTKYNDPNNIYISTLAASMGFNILEKHYTRYEGEKRIDYHTAVGYKKMKQIKNKMELALKIYGNHGVLMSAEEQNIYGKVGPMKKAIVAKKNIKKGQIITGDDLWYKRTKQTSNIKQKDIYWIIGSKAKKKIKKDKIIDYSDFESDKVEYDYGVE